MFFVLPLRPGGAVAVTVKEADHASSRVVDEQAERVGTRIRELRRSRGFTLVQLAARTGLSHPFLSQLEREIGRA